MKNFKALNVYVVQEEMFLPLTETNTLITTKFSQILKMFLCITIYCQKLSHVEQKHPKVCNH